MLEYTAQKCLDCRKAHSWTREVISEIILESHLVPSMMRNDPLNTERGYKYGFISFSIHDKERR